MNYFWFKFNYLIYSFFEIILLIITFIDPSTKSFKPQASGIPVASPMLINSEVLNTVPQDAFLPSLSPMANAYRGGGSERLLFF